MKARKIIGIIVSVLIALIFIPIGMARLFGAEQAVAAFVHWGYPMWFMYTVSSIEIVLGILILIPKTRLFATIALLLVMVGAFYTHIRSHDPVSMMSLAIVASALLLINVAILLKARMK